MKNKNQLKTLIITTVIISVVLGGIVGGIAGVVSSNLVALGSSLFGAGKQSAADATNVKQPLVVTNELEIESQTVRVVDEALPAVVSVIATQELQQLPRSSFFDDFFFGSPFQPPTQRQQVSSGSGFIVEEDGLIITNRHVVANDNADYSVVLTNGDTYSAEVLARDSVQDLAIIKIRPKDTAPTEKFPTLTLGSSSEVKIGQTVIAIGNTLGEFRNTVSKGIVSGINRTLTAGGEGIGSELIEGAIQTDAAISSGNSGGPLLNLRGQVIGVNTAVSQAGENIGFALPVDQVRLVLDSVKQYGKIVRPFLGVRYIILNKDIADKNDMKISAGALVVRGESREELAVIPGSPADKAGIRENDIIMEVDGKPVKDGQSLQTLLAKYQVGDTVKLKIYRAGQTVEVDVALTNREE